MLDGSDRPAGKAPVSYAYAQKMRAAMTYMFGVVLELRLVPWHATYTQDGAVIMRGNPSISNTVSTYMMSLQRRKIKMGEASQSARASTWVRVHYFSPFGCAPP